MGKNFPAQSLLEVVTSDDHNPVMAKLAVSASEFKAKCLDLLDQVGRGEIEELEVTKRGRVVARLLPPSAAPGSIESWHGFMRGSVEIPADLDLTAQISDEVWDADLGILHR
jgi:prevent-host-death family protein